MEKINFKKPGYMEIENEIIKINDNVYVEHEKGSNLFTVKGIGKIEYMQWSAFKKLIFEKYNNKNYTIKLESGVILPNDCFEFFAFFKTKIELPKDLNVSNVTDMRDMFYGCENFNADISRWDVSNVKDMHSMFNGCKKFNCDLSKWDISNVERVACMFDGCESFQEDNGLVLL